MASKRRREETAIFKQQPLWKMEGESVVDYCYRAGVSGDQLPLA